MLDANPAIKSGVYEKGRYNAVEVTANGSFTFRFKRKPLHGFSSYDVILEYGPQEFTSLGFSCGVMHSHMYEIWGNLVANYWRFYVIWCKLIC